MSTHEEQIKGPADGLELGKEGEWKKKKIKNVAWVVLHRVTEWMVIPCTEVGKK